MDKPVFTIAFDQLPPSVNEYLAPSVQYRGGKPFVHMYETRKAKAFKKIFGEALKREVKKQGWDKEITKDGHWYLECSFTQSRTNQDSNNYFKVLLDSMTGIVINDDKNVLPRVHRISYSTKDPGFKIALRKVEYVGLFRNEEARQNMIDEQCTSCRFYRGGKCSVLKQIEEARENEHYKKDTNSCIKFTFKKS